MNEYYCPNCDATLNDQPGFDPTVGAWTCTECGQQLLDDDVYAGDVYEGVAWFCDNCNSLLNRQYGFSDIYGSWTCTECGYTNSITADDIYESEADYQYHKTMNSSTNDEDDDDDKNMYYCPDCGATLNEQYEFDEYEEEWECTCCGTTLQYSYDNDEYEIAEEPENEDSSYSTIDTDTENEYRSCTNDNSSKKDKSWIAIIICFIIALGIPLGMMLKFEIEEKIAISEEKINAGFYKDLIDENYRTVEAHFYSAGFTNVELIDLDDSGIMFWKEGDVETISIAGNSTFDSTNWFAPDSKVVISYH